MSFMTKFFVQGNDAGKMLNYLSTANVDGETGKITYTQWLNSDGKVEADVTVCKITPTKYMVVVTDTMHRHVESLMNRHLRERPELHAVVTDVGGGFAQMNLQGPNSRKMLSALTSSDVSDQALPYRGAIDIPIGFARVLCIRITYVGELGYELYVPAEQAVHVYERIAEVGKSFGMEHVGLKALGSLRMEKGYRDYGHDIDNTDTLMEVGLGFTCDFEKPGGFKGMHHVLAQKEKGVSALAQRLVQVLVNDPEPMMYHAEVVFRNGTPLGYIRSASYGHTLGGAVGLAMIEYSKPITNKFIDQGKWEVQIAGKMYPATVSLRPMYDPDNLKIKA
jgi:glycine cleavage system aminomethyltransferase T